MKGKERDFQIFVKPVGPVCNMACSYCYYLGKKDLFTGQKDFLLSDELLERYIVQHFEAAGKSDVYFSWHGGEPLIAGLGFFRKVIYFQEKHKPDHISYFNGLQTNGILLDDIWCKFLADNNFYIGISIDGPASMHNHYRLTAGGQPSHEKVIRGYKLLVKYGLHPEILCVVSSHNASHPLEVYRYFKLLGAGYMTFLPLVIRDAGKPEGVTDSSVNPGDFGIFLTTIFDEWVTGDIGKIKVQIFEEAARTAFNQEHTLCIFKKECGGVPALEHSGDLYSCDHYVDKDHLLGNIAENTLTSLLDSKEQEDFGVAKYSSIPAYCRKCEVLTMCNGECPRNRFIRTPDGEPGLNYLCAGYRQFFNHSRPFVNAVAQLWKSNQV
ncbi:MAG TPA: anaerobic sulfatase maturase [Bacteroidales bacterium]|nr:anaerobic sulfatase maturase [Bacteroidales bacterium]